MKTLYILLIFIFIQNANALIIDLPPQEGRAPKLGMGYSTDWETFTFGECLTGTPYYDGQNQSYLNFETKIEYKELEKELGFSAGFRYKTGVTTTKASARFLKASKSNSYSVTAIYNGNYRFKDMGMGQPVLTPIGMRLSQNPEQWSKTCGDYYTIMKSYGGKIFFSIRIDFKSEDARKEFEARFSFSSPTTDIVGGFQNFQREFSKKTEVKVMALQLGGDVTKLSQVFHGSTGNGQDDSSFEMVKCSLGDFGDCQKVLKNAISYATHDFPKQFKKLNVEEDPTDQFRPNASLMGVTLAPYTSAGIFVGFSSQMNDTIKVTREDMLREFNEVLNQFQRANSILDNKAIKKSPRQLNQLKSMKANLYDQLEKMAKAAEICLNEPLRCSNQYKKVRLVADDNPNGFKLYANDDFVIDLETYEQYCDFGLSPFSTEELTNTVQHMVNAAKLEDLVVWENMQKQKLDVCYASFKILRGMSRLNLNFDDMVKVSDSHPEHLVFDFPNLYAHRITDLRPIMTFDHWREIDLTNQNISETDQFVSMNRLSSIELRGNNLYDVVGLLQYPNLRYLGLSNNDIMSVDALRNLNHLKLVDIRNNPSVEFCPFAESDRCLLVDISSNNQLFTVHRPLSVRRWGHSSILLNSGDVLITGGAGDRHSKVSEIYNDYYGSFSLISQLKRARYEHRMTLLDSGKVLITGGWSALDSAEVFDPSNQSFQLISRPMNQKRADHQALKLDDGRVLLTGGYIGTNGQFSGLDSTSSAEYYSEKTGKFVGLPSMKVPRAGHSMTKLANGQVVVIGGFHPNQSISSIEVFDPKTNKFRFAPARLKYGRGYHSAHLLDDGQIAIIGGYSNRAEAIDTIEIFNPETNKVTLQKFKMNEKRGRHQSILLSHGGILIIGGDEKLTPAMDNHSDAKHAHVNAEMIDLRLRRSTYLQDNLAFSRVDSSAVKVSRNRVLITGGEGPVSSITAELFEF